MRIRLLSAVNVCFIATKFDPGIPTGCHYGPRDELDVIKLHATEGDRFIVWIEPSKWVCLEKGDFETIAPGVRG